MSSVSVDIDRVRRVDAATRWWAHPLARPLAALAVLLLADFLLVPGFFQLSIRDGHLYGSLVDIANRAAPLMLAALEAGGKKVKENTGAWENEWLPAGTTNAPKQRKSKSKK